MQGSVSSEKELTLADSNTDRQRIGRLLRASTSSFSVGCRTLETDLPVFGSLVRVELNGGGVVYGLVYDAGAGDDPQRKKANGEDAKAEKIFENQRQRR